MQLQRKKMLLKIGNASMFLTSFIIYFVFGYACRFRTTGRQGGHNYLGAESLREASKSPNNATRIFFNAVHLLPKDLRFEHGDVKLPSCSGSRLTSLRPFLLFYVYVLRLLSFGTRSGFFWRGQVGKPAKQQTQQD